MILVSKGIRISNLKKPWGEAQSRYERKNESNSESIDSFRFGHLERTREEWLTGEVWASDVEYKQGRGSTALRCWMRIGGDAMPRKWTCKTHRLNILITNKLIFHHENIVWVFLYFFMTCTICKQVKYERRTYRYDECCVFFFLKVYKLFKTLEVFFLSASHT